MTTAVPAAPLPPSPAPAKRSGQATFFLIISLLGLLFSFISATLILGLSRILQDAIPPEVAQNFSSTMGSYIVLILISFGACLISLIYAIREMSGNPAKPLRPRVRWAAMTVLLVLWGVLMLQFRQITALLPEWLGAPMLLFLIAVIPLLWFVELGRRNILEHSRSFSTGSVTFTVTIGLALILIIEIGILISAILLVMSTVFADPQMMRILQNIAMQGFNQEAITQQMLLQLEPMLKNPVVIVSLIGGVGVLIPIIEESFKPLSLWFVSGARITPPQGAILGMLCGFAFALWESYGYMQLTLAADDMLLIGLRAGTGMLHVFCSGLVGWGLASAWWYKKAGRFAWTFFTALLIHGAWNTFSVVSGLGGAAADSGSSLSTVTLGVFGGMLVLMVIFQAMLNGKLQQEQAQIEAALNPAAAPATLDFPQQLN